MLPSAGKSGSVIFIRGTAISAATEVTFNGVAAKFEGVTFGAQSDCASRPEWPSKPSR
jgi:hypothetical protein